MTKHAKQKSLEGMGAIVTGGGRGIGLAIATELAARGASIGIVGKSEERLSLAAENLKKCGAKVVSHASCDVTDPKSVSKAFSKLAKDLGTISILVNNAGAATSSPFLKSTLDTWRQTIEVNLTGTYICTQEVLSRMIDQKKGRIVNIASTAALKGYRYVTAYCAAKAGVVGFTRSLALELAPLGITVNAISPGFTETDMLSETVAKAASKTGRSMEEIRKELIQTNPQGRFIQPSEIASAVAWLCETEQSAITGQNIVISGGEV